MAHLPDELWRLVLESCDYSEACVLACVSRQLRRLASAPSVWQALCKRHTIVPEAAPAEGWRAEFVRRWVVGGQLCSLCFCSRSFAERFAFGVSARWRISEGSCAPRAPFICGLRRRPDCRASCVPRASTTRNCCRACSSTRDMLSCLRATACGCRQPCAAPLSKPRRGPWSPSGRCEPPGNSWR